MRIQQQKQHWEYSINEEMLVGNAYAVANYHDTDPDASEFRYRL